jgi:hypothetical protein
VHFAVVRFGAAALACALGAGLAATPARADEGGGYSPEKVVVGVDPAGAQQARAAAVAGEG